MVMKFGTEANQLFVHDALSGECEAVFSTWHIAPRAPGGNKRSKSERYGDEREKQTSKSH